MPVTIWVCSDEYTCGFTTYEPNRYGYKCPHCGEDLQAAAGDGRRATDGTTPDD